MKFIRALTYLSVQHFCRGIAKSATGLKPYCGSVGEPLLSEGFYLLNPNDPDPADGGFRDNISPLTLNRPNPNDTVVAKN